MVPVFAQWLPRPQKLRRHVDKCTDVQEESVVAGTGCLAPLRQVGLPLLRH